MVLWCDAVPDSVPFVGLRVDGTRAHVPQVVEGHVEKNGTVAWLTFEHLAEEPMGSGRAGVRGLNMNQSSTTEECISYM